MFIVEGDSAGGTAKQGRDSDSRPSSRSAERSSTSRRRAWTRLSQNKEVQGIITAIGTGIGEEFDIEKARYHKIVILTDADVDGAHIRTLLLTLLFRHMRGSSRPGYVYIALPPLYRVKMGKEIVYLKDDPALDRFKTNDGRKIVPSRFKGLGEMNANELWETSMNPETRTLVESTSKTQPSPTPCSPLSWATTLLPARLSSSRTPKTFASWISRSGEKPMADDIQVKKPNSRHRHQRRNLIVVPRLCDVGHRVACALPDVRDGLKPVQRRIIYSMFENGLISATGPHRKSSNVVGEVMGNYHPHATRRHLRRTGAHGPRLLDAPSPH